MWQDFVFTAGSAFSILVLLPTLRDRMATVPMGTSLPSAVIGLVYGAAFFTMGMTLSAVGSLATALLWSLIAALRSPSSPIAGRLDRSASSGSSHQQSAAPTAD